jgi:hypothetical protein
MTIANGQKFNGCVTVSTLDGEPQVRQGVIFVGRSALFISNPGAFGYEESRKELLEAVKLSEKRVSPISFRLTVPVEGREELFEGTLP